MRLKRFIVTTIAALYFGALVGLAFVPTSDAVRGEWFWPVGVFVPVGVLLLLLFGGRRWWEALGFGVLGAAWLEAAQTLWMPLGYASFMDVVLAGAGVGVGVAVAWVITGPNWKYMRSHESPRMIAQAGTREIP